MREEILDRFRSLRRRQIWVRAWDLFLEIGFVMTLATAGTLLVDRLAFELGWAPSHLARWTLPLMGGTVLLAAILSLSILAVRHASPAELAWRVDRSVGGDARFLSALELAAAGSQTGFAPLVLRDAARLTLQPARIVPPPRLGYRSAIAIALLATAALAAFPPQETSAPTAGFRATPERGAAPLEISFESLHQGIVETISWDFGDGGRDEGVDVVHRYEQPGRFTVVQEIRGPGGRARAERSVEILPVDHVVAAFEAEPLKGRARLRVRFRNLSQNAERFEWDLGDGTKSPDPEPRHEYARPGLYTVRLRAFGTAGLDEMERGRYIKVVGEDAPLADFRAHPRSGKAPLRVGFEDLSTGKTNTWKWDFGDLHAGAERFSTERNPGHVFRAPGRYTVELRVEGPGGEDEERKVAYIVVEEEKSSSGGGGGGGGAGAGGGAGKANRGGGGAGKGTGKLFGDRTAPRKIGVDPTIVTPPARGGEKTLREQKVFSRGDAGSQEPKEHRVTEVLPRYERVAEETMGQERISPAVRDYVKRYFEEIRPKE